MIYVFRYSMIVLYTVFWGVLGCLASLVDARGRSMTWVARSWVGWIHSTCGISVRAEGLERIDPGVPYVYMANHQSVFDIAAIITILPGTWRFVAKRELVWIPFFGWTLWLAGNIIVDRGNRAKAVASLDRGALRIRSGTSVIVFPEGTRSATGELGEFKSGGFHLAIKAGVPIVPISVSGSHRITPPRSLRIESGEIRVEVGEPIPTANLGSVDRHQLKTDVRKAILQGLHGVPTH